MCSEVELPKKSTAVIGVRWHTPGEIYDESPIAWIDRLLSISVVVRETRQKDSIKWCWHSAAEGAMLLVR